MHRSRAALVAVSSAVVLVLSGCGSPDPGPTTTPESSASPSPSPTEGVDPAEAARQQDVDEATALVVEFVEVANAGAQAGYVDWAPLAGMVSGEARTIVIEDFEANAAAGLRETGPRPVVGTELVEHVPGPTGPAGTVVVLAVCLDGSQTDLVDADGESLLAPDRAPRTLVTYSTQRQDDGRWTVTQTEPHPGETC